MIALVACWEDSLNTVTETSLNTETSLTLNTETSLNTEELCLPLALAATCSPSTAAPVPERGARIWVLLAVFCSVSAVRTPPPETARRSTHDEPPDDSKDVLPLYSTGAPRSRELSSRLYFNYSTRSSKLLIANGPS